MFQVNSKLWCPSLIDIFIHLKYFTRFFLGGLWSFIKMNSLHIGLYGFSDGHRGQLWTHYSCTVWVCGGVCGGWLELGLFCGCTLLSVLLFVLCSQNTVLGRKRPKLQRHDNHDDWRSLSVAAFIFFQCCNMDSHLTSAVKVFKLHLISNLPFNLTFMVTRPGTKAQESDALGISGGSWKNNSDIKN